MSIDYVGHHELLFFSLRRASRAKVLRLEKEAQEMEKSMEALRHAQAKCAELEKTNKKLYSQTHSDRKEIIKLREVRERFEISTHEILAPSML